MNPPVPLASSAENAAVAAPRVTVSDLVALVKPRVTLTVLLTALGGLFLARPEISRGLVLWTLLGTSMIVGGANALNMFLERDIDRHMTRTMGRPLPSGRMSAGTALAVGVALSVLAIPVLLVGTNPITAVLAAIANVSYVMIYTPMKQRSWTAVIVGAVPGAIPPLLGWTAASGTLELGGVALFAILFFWQVPHFHAIALSREAEYTRAGLKVLPAAVGDERTRAAMLRWTVAVVVSTFLPFSLHLATTTYLFVAGALGVLAIGYAARGLSAGVSPRWAKGFFGLSIPYLLAIFAALLATRA